MDISYLIEEPEESTNFYSCLTLSKLYFSPVHLLLLVSKFISLRLTRLVVLALQDSEYNLSLVMYYYYARAMSSNDVIKYSINKSICFTHCMANVIYIVSPEPMYIYSWEIRWLK